MLRFQQAEVELSRIRREAMEQAAEAGTSYAEIARQVGLTRGRVSQIRTSGPAIERAFFGVGPIELGVPFRHIDDRDHPLIAAEDLAARDQLTDVLSGLAFHVEHSGILPDSPWRPSGADVIAICGPKSSTMMQELYESDPALAWVKDAEQDRWLLQDRQVGTRFESPMDDVQPEPVDIGYLGRLKFDGDRSVIVIAGVHAIGSVGVIHYLQTNVRRLYDEVGTKQFSMVVRSHHEGETITASEPACPPILH